MCYFVIHSYYSSIYSTMISLHLPQLLMLASLPQFLLMSEFLLFAFWEGVGTLLMFCDLISLDLEVLLLLLLMLLLILMMVMMICLCCK